MDRSPFKFLDSYTRNDSDIFFGREKETEEIYSRLFYSNLMLIYGPSGTGKTSIIQCGVANRFSENDWKPVFVRRKGNIMHSIRKELKKVAIKPLPEAKGHAGMVYSIYLDYLIPVYIIFDQFEELFIFGTQSEKQAFVSFVREVTGNPDLNTHIIISIREEYLASLSEFEDDIPSLFQNRVRVEKMKKAQALQAIEGPCNARGVKLEDSVTQSVIGVITSDTGTIELTWLQVLLDRLYKKASSREGEIVIKNSDVESLGKIGDVLGSFLEDQLKNMKNGDEGEAVLKTMVSSDGTKKQLSIQEIQEALITSGHRYDIEKIGDIVRYFINVRILSDKDENDRYELKHDSLAAKVFERLTLYEKELLEVRQFVEHAYKVYETRKALLNDEDLKFIQPYEDRLILSRELNNFVQLSKKESARKKRRKRVVFASIAIFLLLIMAGFTTWALIERGKAYQQQLFAEKQKDIAEEQKMIAEGKKEELAVKNIALDKAKNEAVNAKIIVENELYRNIKNSLSVAPLKMNVLYREVDNPVNITASGINTESIFPVLYGYLPGKFGDSSRIYNGVARIVREGNQFIVSDFHPEVSRIMIGAMGITGKGDTLNLGAKPYRIKNFPGPFVTLGGHDGGNIAKSDILEKPILKINYYTDYKIDFGVEAFNATVYHLNGETSGESSESGIFTQAQLEMVENCNPGDILVIDDIKLHAPPKFDHNPDIRLSFIVDGNIFEKEREKRNRINKILNLARQYEKKPQASYRLVREAYDIDKDSEDIQDELLNSFMGIQRQFFDELNGRCHYNLQYLEHFGSFVVNLMASPGENADPNEITESGLYMFKGKSVVPVFLLDTRIHDAAYNKVRKQYYLLIREPKQLIILNEYGEIVKTIDPENPDVVRIYPSPDGSKVVLTAAGEMQYFGKHDNRAVLIDLDTDKQDYLWGNKYQKGDTPEAKKEAVSDVCFNSAQQMIYASFNKADKFEVWGYDGRFVKAVDLGGSPENMVLSPEKMLLIKRIGEEGYSSSELVCYNLNDDSLYVRPIPGQYSNFEFSDCGGYILFGDGKETTVYNCRMEEVYNIPYNMPIWEETITFNDGKITIASNNCQMVLPLEDRTKSIIEMVEEKHVFGPLAALPAELEEAVNMDTDNQ